MCYSGWVELEGDMKDLPKLSPKTDIDSRITSSIDQYTHVIGSNHGIKEKYLRKLLVPLSIRISDLDPTWIVGMSNFGGLRGQIAHMSGKANQPPDPAAIKSLVRSNLLPGLKDLDTRLSGLISAAGPVPQSLGWIARLRRAFQLIWSGV